MTTQEENKKSKKCTGCPKWTPTSPQLFEDAEFKMYKILKNYHETKFIEISNKNLIRTLKVGTHDDTERPPLVLVHGFAAGAAFWMWNLDSLSKERNVYAIDMLGFARSSRPVFPSDCLEVDDLFVQSIEDWRRQMRLEKIILLGHSFGGYVSSLYTMKHPERVLHLVLDDPWGFPPVPEPGTGVFSDIPKWKIKLFKILTSFNPLSALRAAGPWGPSLVGRLRSDIVAKYEPLYGEEENPIVHYIFHCNAQKPSGETAFQTVSDGMVFARNALFLRFRDFPDDKPFTIITGSDSWVNMISDFETIQAELSNKNKMVEVHYLDDAGHHVHADRPLEFNRIVNNICEDVQKTYTVPFRGLVTSI